MKKILIATTNQGKFREITSELSDLPFTFISLKQINKKIVAPDENEDTIEKNATLKAKYYAKKTGLITIADDSGLFIKALSGWPGVNSARVANSDETRRNEVLKRMEKNKNRQATFKVVLVICDPKDNTLFISHGQTTGVILFKPTKKIVAGFGYDPIFYVNKIKKAYANMTMTEKNSVSHRGKALIKIKLFLMKQYSFKQLVAAVAIVVKDKKMLMTQRRDHRPEFDDKWEFPGGGVDNGETVEQALFREIKEETGYNIQIIEKLPQIWTAVACADNYQVFIIAYICKIKSGRFQTSDTETKNHGWFTIKESLKTKLMPLNKKCIQDKKNLAILKKYIKY